MLRLFLLASLAVATLASSYGGSLLGGVLLPQHVSPAIRLVQARYVGISQPAAVDIVRLVVQRPSPILLQQVQLTAVPVIRQRLSYLETVLDRLPVPVFSGGLYSGGLLNYVHGLGLGVSSSSLVDPLALIDARLATSLVAPVSVPAFTSFVGSQLLHAGSGLSVFPGLNTIYSRLSSLQLNPLPIGFQRLSLGGLATSPSSAVYNTVQPALTRLGLTGLVRPHTVVGGLVDYLHGQQLPATQFVSGISSVSLPSITRLVASVQLTSVTSHLSFLPVSVIRRDVIPLLALRYYALPRLIRRNFSFQTVVPRYLSTLDLGGYSSFNRGFISHCLSGFDSYIGSLAKGYHGSLWDDAIWGSW